MIARKQLDVRWSDIGFGLLACAGLARLGGRPPVSNKSEQPLLPARSDGLVCLSVRSGFDLLLTEVAWPAGDEVLVSAITIPDMSRILREHGLVPVPVDVDAGTLAMDETALDRALTSRTRAVLVAHLFGSRLPLTRLLAWARERGLMVIEDCAQAYVGNEFHGDEDSDVRLFSFGTIKTATALGGGVMLIRDGELLERLRHRHARWPVQKTSSYARRLLKFAVFIGVQSPWSYGTLFGALRMAGKDPDATIMALGRGFAGGDFFSRLRHQPCAALLAMLAWRLATYDVARVEQRTRVGEAMLRVLKNVEPLGAHGAQRTHWLFPLRVGNGAVLQTRLWSAGFDATRASSSLHAVPAASGIDAPIAHKAMSEVLYVPVYAAMGRKKLDELATLLNEHAEPASAAER